MIKKKTFWGALGSLLVVLGSILSIAFAIRDDPLLLILLAGAGIVVGILMIGWVLGD